MTAVDGSACPSCGRPLHADDNDVLTCINSACEFYSPGLHVRLSREGRDRAEAEYDAEHGEGAYTRWREAKAEEGRMMRAARDYDAIRDEVLRSALGRLRRERESGGIEGGSAAEMIARMDAELAVEQRRDRERRGEALRR